MLSVPSAQANLYVNVYKMPIYYMQTLEKKGLLKYLFIKKKLTKVLLRKKGVEIM